MILQLERALDARRIDEIADRVKTKGFAVTEVNTQAGTYLVCISKHLTDVRAFGALPGVLDVHVVSDNYKLVSSKWKMGPGTVFADDTPVGGGHFTVMAGPCAIESEAQAEAIAVHLKEQGIPIMRGGVFKPRSSPYSFQGLGTSGLKLFHDCCRRHGLKNISEVMETAQIGQMYPYVDIFQVGARNAQNFNLLHALGKTDKPVLLKRGPSGTIDELLHAAEYIFSSGNERIILCERGIRTFEQASRNTFDINAIPILKKKTHLPVVADPSHGIGLREHVPAIALAALAAGADGLIYEVHEKPEEALSDSQQTLNFDESMQLVDRIGRLKNALMVS